MTAVPAWLHLSPDTTAEGVVTQAVDKATGGLEDVATVARYVVEALTAAGLLAARLPEHLVGDGPCHDCGAVNIRWFADSPLWNRVMGGPDATDDPGGIVCIYCFVKRAHGAGFNPSAWRLSIPAEEDE